MEVIDFAFFNFVEDEKKGQNDRQDYEYRAQSPKIGCRFGETVNGGQGKYRDDNKRRHKNGDE
jgi:hypothetical protein